MDLHMDILRFNELRAAMQGFGFDLPVREFAEFIGAQDDERRQWLETGSKFEVLDWLAVELRDQGWSG